MTVALLASSLGLDAGLLASLRWVDLFVGVGVCCSLSQHHVLSLSLVAPRHALSATQAYEDGSLTLRPGFSSTAGVRSGPAGTTAVVSLASTGPGAAPRYKFQSQTGAIYEYCVELSSSTEDRELVKR